MATAARVSVTTGVMKPLLPKLSELPQDDNVGKTTTANQVYHHAITRQFPRVKLFVSVSRSPNMMEILRDIAQGVGITDTAEDDEKQLVNKRYFVAIHDLWDTKAWETIMLALLNNDYENRIITTTRSVAVVSCCSFEGGYVYHMEDLDSTDSQKLIFRRVFCSEGSHYPHLEYVPDEILGKYGGLPVATIIVSNVLADQHTKAEWERVLHALGSGLPMLTFLMPLATLHVLILEAWYLKDHHLENIEKLFYLKYLHIRSYSITNLPRKIGELQYLETLDIRGTAIIELPSTMAKLQRLAHLYVDWNITFPDGMIGKMHSLEELMTYGVKSWEQGKALQDFSKLTKLRRLALKWSFDWPEGLEGISQAESFYSCVGTLLASCSLHSLYIVDASYVHYPLSLDMWRPTAPCILQILQLKQCMVYAVPNWMASHGNLRVLELNTFFMRSEDVEILGAISSLLFLKLVTIGGANGKIIVHGSNRFRSLKYFSLFITGACGTSLEFEEGSMPKVEHLKLEFPVHNMSCISSAFNLGIQHLSALSKVEIKIVGDCDNDTNYVPVEVLDHGIVNCIAYAIKNAVETLPKHPTIRFETEYNDGCEHFKSVLRWINQKYGVLTEWFKVWEIEAEMTEQASSWRDFIF
ncbi:disease resistance protein RGA5-like [Miscanthus floridulus]|uniref:disease resistance protein RGA5-like n=1 Tax=Miscanthus floridulus TaxID=154761 RepID=UPI00345970A6